MEPDDLTRSDARRHAGRAQDAPGTLKLPTASDRDMRDEQALLGDKVVEHAQRDAAAAALAAERDGRCATVQQALAVIPLAGVTGCTEASTPSSPTSSDR